MCNCTKKIPKTGPSIQGNFALNGSSGLRSLSNNDMVVRYYIGETGEYVGSATGINYGVRTYNTRVMVHVDDLAADNQLFADAEQVETRSVQAELSETVVDEDVTHDVVFKEADGEIIPDMVSKPRVKRTRSPKETEANGESL